MAARSGKTPAMQPARIFCAVAERSTQALAASRNGGDAMCAGNGPINVYIVTCALSWAVAIGSARPSAGVVVINNYLKPQA